MVEKTKLWKPCLPTVSGAWDEDEWVEYRGFLGQ